MGAQQSNSAQIQKSWSSTEIRLLSTPGQPRLVQSVTVPSIYAERYVGQMLNKNQLEELAILRERRVPRQNIVNVYDYQIKKGLFGCARNVDCFDIVTERVPFRLSQFQNLGEKQMIYIFHDSLCGYREIYRYGRLCLPTAQAIGIKQNGQVKVWINQNWSDNAFRPAKSQAQSIQCLWNCIKLCGDYRSYWNFTQNLYKLIPINFQNTINMIRNLYSKQIVEGRHSIQQILKSIPINLPYSPLLTQNPIITTIGMTLNMPQSVPASIQVPINKPQSVHIQIPHNESRQGQQIIYGNTTQMLKPKLVTQNQLMIRPRAYSQQVRKTNAYSLNSHHNNEPQFNIIQTKLVNMQPPSNLIQQHNHGIIQSGLPASSMVHQQPPPMPPPPIINPSIHVKPQSVLLNQATMQIPSASTTISPMNTLHASTFNSKNYGNLSHVDHGMIPQSHNVKINTSYEGGIRNRTVTLPSPPLSSQVPKANIINMACHQEPANINLNLIRTNQSKYKQSQNQPQQKFLQVPQQQLLSISASSSKEKPKSTFPYHKISLSNHQNDNGRRVGTTHENLSNQGNNFRPNIGTNTTVFSHPQPKINAPISNYISLGSQAQHNIHTQAQQYRQMQQRVVSKQETKQRKYSPNSINTSSNNSHINKVNFIQPMVNLNQSAVGPSYCLNNMNKISNPENSLINENMNINSSKANTNKITINYLSSTATRPLTPIIYERNTGVATNQSASNSYYSNNYNDPRIYSIAVSSNQMVPNPHHLPNTVNNTISIGAPKGNNSNTGTPSTNINMLEKPKSVSAPKTTTVPGSNNLDIDIAHTNVNAYGNTNTNTNTNAKNLNKITIHHEMSSNSNNSIVNSRRNSFNAKSSRQNRTISSQYQIKYQSRHKNDWHKNQVTNVKVSSANVSNITKYSPNLNNNATTTNHQHNGINMTQLKNQKVEPLGNSFFSSSTTKTLHHHYQHMKNTQNTAILNGANQYSSYKNSQFAPENLLQTISNKAKINITKNQAISNISNATTNVQQNKDITAIPIKTPAISIANPKPAEPQKSNNLNLNINLNNIRTHELNYNSNTQRPQYAHENPNGDYYVGSGDSNYQVPKQQKCNVVTDNITKGLKTQQNEQVPQNLPYQKYYKYNEHISQRQTMAIDQTVPAYYRQQDISISVTNDVTNPAHQQQDQVINSINTDRTTNINSITDRYHVRGNSNSYNNEQGTVHAELYQIFNHINSNYSSNPRHPHSDGNSIKENQQVNIVFQSPIKITRTQHVIENHDHLTKSKNWDDLRYQQNYKYYNNGEGLNNNKNLKKQRQNVVEQQEKIQFLNQNNQYQDYQQLVAKNRYQFNNQTNPPQYQIVNKRPAPAISQKNAQNIINSMRLDLQKQDQNAIEFQSPNAKSKPIQNQKQPQGNRVGHKQQENIYGYSADSDTRKVAQEFKYLLRSIQKSPRSSNQNSNNSSPNKNTDAEGLFDKDNQKDVHSYSSGNIVHKYRNPVTNFQQYQQYQKQMEYYQHRGYSKENQLDQQLQLQIEQRQRKNKQLLINTMAIPQRWDQQQSLSQNF